MILLFCIGVFSIKLTLIQAFVVVTRQPRRPRCFRAQHQELFKNNDNNDDEENAYERYRKRLARRQQRKQQPSRRRIPIQGQVQRQRASDVSGTNKNKHNNTLPLSQLLKELDRYQIRYPPDASRHELEDALWKQRDVMDSSMPSELENENKEKSKDNHMDDSSSLSFELLPPRDTLKKVRHKLVVDTSATTRQQRNRWQRVIRKTKTTLSRQNIPFTLKQTWKRMIRRKTAQTVLQKTNADGRKSIRITRVQDVDYHYVQHRKNDPIDVPAVLVVNEVKQQDYEEQHTKQPNESDTASQSISFNASSTTDTTSRSLSFNASSTAAIYQQPSPVQRQKLPSLRPRPQASSFRAVSELKSASSSTRIQPRQSKKRRVYNPYNNDRHEMDSVDRIGHFLADSVDRLFWGQYDRNEEESPKQQQQKELQDNVSKQTQSSHHQQNRKQQQHWKDRLEERLDSVMGIHKDGDAYHRWFQQEQQGEGEHQPSTGNQRRKHDKDKPFWEQEGSLMALLLGRNKSGQRLSSSWEQALFPRGQEGSLVAIFRTAAQTTLVMASYVCRWASVRGAIPQPLVVLGVSSAGLCVRHHRFRAILLALILIRTLGELVHGSLYGQDGWEDNDNETDWEDTDDETDNESPTENDTRL